MSYTTISPVCVSCQGNIGHIYTLYNRIKDKKVEKFLNETGYKPSDATIVDNISMKEFLDKITDLACCRQAILGHNLIVQDSI